MSVEELQRLEMKLIEQAVDGSFVPIIPRRLKLKHVLLTCSHGIAPCEDTELEIIKEDKRSKLFITHEYLVTPITTLASIKAGCIGIIGTYNRSFSDLDRIDLYEMKGYHKALLEVVKVLRIYGEVAILSIHGWDDERERKRIKVRDPETGRIYLTNVMEYQIDLGIGNYPPRVEPPKDEEKRKIWKDTPTMAPVYAGVIKRSLESFRFRVGIGQYFRSEFTPNVTKTFGDPERGIHTCNIEIAKSVRLNPELCKIFIEAIVYAAKNLENTIKWSGITYQ